MTKKTQMKNGTTTHEPGFTTPDYPLRATYNSDKKQKIKINIQSDHFISHYSGQVRNIYSLHHIPALTFYFKCLYNY